MDEIIKVLNNIKKDNDLDFSIFENKKLLFGSGLGEKSRLDIKNRYFEISFLGIDIKEILIYKYFISKAIDMYLNNTINNSLLKKLLLNNQIHEVDFKKAELYMNSGTLILISSENVDYNLNLIYEIYGKNIMAESINNNIILFKNITEDIDFEILSIYSAIVENSLEEPYIAYSHNNLNYKDINSTYNNLINLINISKYYLPKKYILKEENLRLIYLLDNLDKESKTTILNLNENKVIIDKMDKELILTITTLVENDMNLQKASEKLFIHRNTLNYRIKKFEKEFNIDLKNIKNLIYIYILILLKRESDVKYF